MPATEKQSLQAVEREIKARAEAIANGRSYLIDKQSEQIAWLNSVLDRRKTCTKESSEHPENTPAVHISH